MIPQVADHRPACSCALCGAMLFDWLATFWERRAERTEGREWSDYAEQASICGKTAAAYRATITREHPREGA